MRTWATRDSQRVVPRPAVSASPENLLEMSLSTKSETLGVESAIHPPWDSDALLGFKKHCCKPPYNPSFYFSAQCRMETGGCLSRLIPLSPSRRQALNICLHVLSRDGSKPLFCKRWQPVSLYCDSYFDISSNISYLRTLSLPDEIRSCHILALYHRILFLMFLWNLFFLNEG